MKFIKSGDLPFVPSSHEDQDKPGVVKRVLATKSDLQPGQTQMVNWARLSAGHSFEPHYHEDMQEMFVILSGDVELAVDGETFKLSAGDAVVIDPREVHQMWNHGQDPVDFLAFGISSEQGGKTVVVES